MWIALVGAVDVAWAADNSLSYAPPPMRPMRPMPPPYFAPGMMRPLPPPGLRPMGPMGMGPPGMRPMGGPGGQFMPGGMALRPGMMRRPDFPRGRVCFGPAETRDKIATHGLAEPFRALRTGGFQGEALRARLCRWRPDEFIYEIAVLRRDGRIVHIYMNAQNGENLGAFGDADR